MVQPEKKNSVVSTTDNSVAENVDFGIKVVFQDKRNILSKNKANGFKFKLSNAQTVLYFVVSGIMQDFVNSYMLKIFSEFSEKGSFKFRVNGLSIKTRISIKNYNVVAECDVTVPDDIHYDINDILTDFKSVVKETFNNFPSEDNGGVSPDGN